MQSVTCPKCGAPVPPGAAFCSYCGTPLSTAGAPLPSGPSGLAPPPPPYAPEAPYGAPPPRPRRTGRIIAVVVIILVVIVAVIALAYYLTPAPAIQVNAINIWAPDNACGLNSNPVYFDGFNGSTNATQTFEFGMPNFNATTCTIASVTTNTSGFSLSQIQVPLSIGANATGSMNITITSPTSPFSGNLNLVLG